MSKVQCASTATRKHLLKMLKSHISKVPVWSLPDHNGCKAQKLRMKYVPGNNPDNAAGRVLVLVDVTVWWGDPDVEANACTARFMLWENYALNIGYYFIKENPAWIHLLTHTQFSILAEVLGK